MYKKNAIYFFSVFGVLGCTSSIMAALDVTCVLDVFLLPVLPEGQ